MKTAIILMTALVPTTGHADLISFASALDVDRVAVLLCGRTFEPFDPEDRATALREHFANDPKVDVRLMMDDHAPQNPPDHPDFWGWWSLRINRAFPGYVFDYVVASEPYGQNVAASLGAQFIPYDIERQMNAARGADARNDPWGRWTQIIPSARRHLMLTATIFGQESVGKTTVARAAARSLDMTFAPEWARPYLEEVGSELDEQKMYNIVVGQGSLQQVVRQQAAHPVAIFDTDLFSTIGYYRISQMTPPERLEAEALRLSSDVYYVMPDTIPFCPDPLRYGGHERESDTDFWVQILQEFDLEYVMVPSGSVGEKTGFITEDIYHRFVAKNRPVNEFARE